MPRLIVPVCGLLASALFSISLFANELDPAVKARVDRMQSKIGETKKTYGDWSVWKSSDRMDVIQSSVLMTDFVLIDPAIGRSAARIGFRLMGDRVASLNTSMEIAADTTWPRCAQDLASISIDGKTPIYLVDVKNAGDCNGVSLGGKAIKQMLSGEKAEIKIGPYLGSISLDGFQAAWKRARELSRN